MKVVVNKCYGGFGLSLNALKELVKRKAACIESVTPQHYYGGDNPNFKHRDWQKDWQNDFQNFENIGDGMMADKHRNWNIYKDGMLFSLKDDYNHSVRTDKDLIDVVETMGAGANGFAAELRVVEIPDGIEWEIDEYDGIETIHETHRSW